MEWNDLFNNISSYERNKRDYNVPLTAMKSVDGNIVLDRSKYKMFDHYNMTEHSFSQLCTRLGMPVRYMRKCFDTDTAIFDKNVNFWIKEAQDATWLMRTRDSLVRAFLSDRYAVLDNMEVVTGIVKIRQEAPDMNIKDFYMDENYFNLRCVFPEKLNMNGRKDPVFLGVNLLNSEVGLKRVTIEVCLWRQVCSNGLIIAESHEVLFNQRHLFVKHENLTVNFLTALNKAYEVGKGYLQKFRDTSDIIVDDEKITHLLTELPESFAEKVNFSIEEPTLFGLINAITSSAKELPFEQRYEMEKFAGKLLVA